MNATLKQAKKTLELIDQSGKDVEDLQKLFPYFSVLLRANVDRINLNDFRKACGLKPAREKKKQNSLLTVDYSIKPSLIGLAIDSHPTRTDVVNIDPRKIERVSMLRLGERSITGHEFLRRLKELGKELYDVRLMEELYKNPEKIPEEWKIGRTYFWGTIFRVGDNLCVACLCWYGGRWNQDYSYLGYVLSAREFGVVGARI
jgi:hypothetical protein